MTTKTDKKDPGWWRGLSRVHAFGRPVLAGTGHRGCLFARPATAGTVRNGLIMFPQLFPLFSISPVNGGCVFKFHLPWW